MILVAVKGMVSSRYPKYLGLDRSYWGPKKGTIFLTTICRV